MKTTFKRWRLTSTSNIHIDNSTIIKELEQERTYKYLGVNEGDWRHSARSNEREDTKGVLPFSDTLG